MKISVVSMPNWLKGLIIISLLGFTLRLLGIWYGLPYLSHPDEARIILDTFSMGHRLSLVPEVPDYPLLYRYLLLFVYGAYYLFGRLIHYFSGNIDFALKFLLDPTPVYLISRLTSVVFGTIIAMPAYYFGARIFKSRKSGVVAVLFVLWEFQLLQHSQWALYSIFYCFVCLMAFYYMSWLVYDSRLRNFLLAGTWVGLSVSVQNQGVFLIPSLFLSYLLVLLNKNSPSKKKIIIYSLASLGLLSICALVGNFYWLFIFQKSWVRMVWMMDVTRVGFSSAAPYAYNLINMAGWFFYELIRQDLLLGIIMVCGLFYALLRHRKEDLIFVLFIIIHLYFTSQWGFRQLHDVISLIPLMCVFGARFLIEITERFSNKKVPYIIAAIAVIPLFLQALAIDIKKMHKDTRIIAKEWIESNIPSGSRIGMDWPVLSVPLESNVPFLLRTPMSEKYYNERLRPFIGSQYEENIKSLPHYSIDELKINSAEPLWPKKMPQQLRLEAGQKPVFRDLYSHFVFKDFDTIINKDLAEYLVINSYVWSMFLFDSDPYKRNLFKPYVLDRLEQNFKHSPEYIDDKRHGYLFFLAQQGRDFYSPLLNQEVKGIKLIKAFLPVNGFGPEIRIYQIIRNEK
ncbi:MAG: glycosyltransferase family 39 protein [Candidatus Omnitrophica bacterium]|nr:glycosyltransferase family 39 protein [Candidatus Omnitrophota bacterium]